MGIYIHIYIYIIIYIIYTYIIIYRNLYLFGGSTFRFEPQRSVRRDSVDLILFPGPWPWFAKMTTERSRQYFWHHWS